METVNREFEYSPAEQKKEVAYDKKALPNPAEHVRLLEQRVNQLELVSEALWQIIRQAEHLEDDFLETVMNDVLMQVKQKKENSKIECSQCKLQIPSTHQKCFYCGTLLNK